MKPTIASLIPLVFLTGCVYSRLDRPGSTSRLTLRDPPSRVARLSFVRGVVSLRPPGRTRGYLQLSTAEDARSAHVGGTAPPIAPTMGSIHLEGEPNRRVPHPPDGALNRPVAVRRTPVEPAIPFEQRRGALDHNPGHPQVIIHPAPRREQCARPEYRPVPNTNVRPKPQEAPKRLETPKPEPAAAKITGPSLHLILRQHNALQGAINARVLAVVRPALPSEPFSPFRRAGDRDVRIRLSS